MIKFILIMFICSNIPGNDCKSLPVPVNEFNSYHECAYYGYDYSSTFLKSMGNENVDKFRMYVVFSCEENNTIWQCV